MVGNKSVALLFKEMDGEIAGGIIRPAAAIRRWRYDSNLFLAQRQIITQTSTLRKQLGSGLKRPFNI